MGCNGKCEDEYEHELQISKNENTELRARIEKAENALEDITDQMCSSHGKKFLEIMTKSKVCVFCDLEHYESLG